MHGSGQQSRLLRWCGAGGGLPRCSAATLGEHDESPRSQSVQWTQPTALHRVTLAGSSCLSMGSISHVVRLYCRLLGKLSERSVKLPGRSWTLVQLGRCGSRRRQSTWFQQQSADS
jgi:hypothetical protein